MERTTSKSFGCERRELTCEKNVVSQKSSKDWVDLVLKSVCCYNCMTCCYDDVSSAAGMKDKVLNTTVQTPLIIIGIILGTPRICWDYKRSMGVLIGEPIGAHSGTLPFQSCMASALSEPATQAVKAWFQPRCESTTLSLGFRV